MGKKAPDAPTSLTMQLFAPGMSILHRAGLGGLACTLAAMQQRFDNGSLKKDEQPAPFVDGRGPWRVAADEIILDFSAAENAGVYLQRLYAFAFQIGKKDGLIRFPGQYVGTSEPQPPALADLQAGLTLTFLQHGKVRKLDKEPRRVHYDPEQEGYGSVEVEYRPCTGYKHQNGWKDFVDNKGRLRSEPIRVDGPILPGAVVRHVAFTSSTAGEEPAERMLPLHFAVVGCLTLPVNRGVAALLAPDVDHLLEFRRRRPLMTPSSARTAIVANAADGALQAQIRSRGAVEAERLEIPRIYAMTFRPTPWASQQKSRVDTLEANPGSNELDVFERALSYFKTRIADRVVKVAEGKGKAKRALERRETFRSHSVVRPLIAENLARGRPWYEGFFRLVSAVNPANDKPFRDQLPFERKGLIDMADDPAVWDDEGERLLVAAVHEAIRHNLGQIKRDTDGEGSKPPSQATKNRWERFRERLRLALVNAKRPDEVRFALSDLFTRAKHVPVLAESWKAVLPKLADHRWRLTRDLALFALASYGGQKDKPDANPDSATQP